MRYRGRKQMSFLQRFSWGAILLLVMGVAFLSITFLMQWMPMTPASIHVYSNGVRQPSTKETVRTFRLIFLLAFGIPGLGMTIAGFVVAGRAWVQRVRAQRLKKEGVCLTAEVVECYPVPIQVNGRSLGRLRCAYTDVSGTTYLFKSGILRMDPMPYLSQNQVVVYHDRKNLGCYFVDIDGSVRLQGDIVEL